MKKIVVSLIALLTLALAFTSCSVLDSMEIILIDEVEESWLEKAKWSGTEVCTVTGDPDYIAKLGLEEYEKEWTSKKITVEELQLLMAFDGLFGDEVTVYSNPLRTKLKIEEIIKYNDINSDRKAVKTIITELSKD